MSNYFDHLLLLFIKTAELYRAVLEKMHELKPPQVIADVMEGHLPLQFERRSARFSGGVDVSRIPMLVSFHAGCHRIHAQSRPQARDTRANIHGRHATPVTIGRHRARQPVHEVGDDF